jgi:outer membrane receptor protein involved in Fe transport
VIRGLSGGNLLALVDGNTLSTFWGEGGFAGDDMYGKIDPEAVERIEVVRGPASVLYGSNALGGVINFISRTSPWDFTDCGAVIGGRARLLAASAYRSWRANLEAYGADPNWRWLVGGTLWRSGDVEDGSGQVQDPSGGHGGFGNAAVSRRLSREAILSGTLQYTHNPEVYRYYRPTQENENERLAIALALEFPDLRGDLPFADRARATLYWQDKEDRRRFFNSSGVLTQSGVAKWETLQAGVQLDKALGCHRLTYGLDLQSTWGESPDDEQFTITPVGGSPRKASPDSIWASLGGYLQDVWQVTPCLALTGSVRLDLFRFESIVDSQYQPPGGLDPLVDEFTDHQLALVGGLQASWLFRPDTALFGGWTRGFRQFAPKFGASQHGYGVLVPSQLLDPVTADQFEVGIRHHGRTWQAELVGYYTRFNDFQNVVRGTFQGQDWYDFDQDTVRDPGEDVYVTVGNGEAFVEGIEFSARTELCALTRGVVPRGWSLGGTFAWNYGTDETNDIPIRHTQPAAGTLRLRFDDPCPARGLWIEAAAQFVRHYDRIPPDRLANDVGYWEDPQVSSSGKRRPWGLPGYSVFDLRAGMNLGSHARIECGVENLLDKLYRPAHARWDAPGRNFFVALEVSF